MITSILIALSYTTYITLDRFILYVSTGSFLYHDYSWYSMENSVHRQHESLYADQQHLTLEAAEKKLQLTSCYEVDEDVKSRITPTSAIAHINDIIYVTAHPKDYDLL